MSENQNGTRTQITDLPEGAADELSDEELRIVSGGAMMSGTNKITGAALMCVRGGDWDTDYSDTFHLSGSLMR